MKNVVEQIQSSHLLGRLPAVLGAAALYFNTQGAQAHASVLHEDSPQTLTSVLLGDSPQAQANALQADTAPALTRFFHYPTPAQEARVLTKRLHQDKKMPIGGNDSVIWTPLDSNFRFGDVVDFPLEKENGGVTDYFQIVMNGCKRADARVKAINPLTVKAVRPSPLDVRTSPVGTDNIRVTEKLARVSIRNCKPTDTLNSSDGNKTRVIVATNAILNANAITATSRSTASAFRF